MKINVTPCEYCLYWDPKDAEEGYCRKHHTYTEPEDYCSRAHRKKEEENKE